MSSPPAGTDPNLSMIWTVISTVLSGVTIYVAGQLIVKLLIEPVQETKRTIAQISHSLIEYADVIHNPDVLAKERSMEVSQHLRKLSAQLRAHLFLVPCYHITASIFGLPTRDAILTAAKQLIGLSNTILSVKDDIYEQIATRCTVICDSLRIYLPADERWPN